MTRAFAIGAGVLGAVLSGSGMPRPAPNAPVASQAAVAVRFDTLATGLGSITSITSAGDSRVFLTIQTGTIRISDGSQILPTPFRAVGSKVICCGEQGLLSAVFHPQYALNGLFFVNYTNTNGDTVIERYQVSGFDRNQADSASAAILLTIDQPFANHNG